MEENEKIVGLGEDTYDYGEDPILEAYCDDCSPKLVALIKYVRNLESAQVAAKEALDTLMLTCERLQDELEKQKEKNKIVTREDIKQKMAEFDKRQQKMLNRDKLGVE